MERIKIINICERMDLLDAVDEMVANHWPAFMMGTSVNAEYWDRLYQPPFSQYQFIAIHQDNGQEKVIGLINAVALPWQGSLDQLPEEGWDRIFTMAMESDDQKQPCQLISALSVTVDQNYRGKNIPQQLILALKEYAEQQGYLGVVVPVRPTLKHLYPLQKFEDYITWVNDQLEPFDPWIRTHWRLGAKIIKIAPKSMTIVHSVAGWHEWTGLQFPQNGYYVIPFGLVPLKIDIIRDIGCYVEPNVWMFHSADK